jgi:ribosomal-protein-alanine N-acetyltransferase
MNKSPYYYTDQLYSARLATRFLTAQDIEPWSEFYNSREAIQFLHVSTWFPDDPAPEPLKLSEYIIRRQLLRYQEKRYGLQVILERDHSTFLGLCGLVSQEVDGQRELEVGYHFFRQHWGRGYAMEAARLFLDFAATHKLSDSVVSLINPDNAASRRVAERNSLTVDKFTRWPVDQEVVVYRKKL